MRTHLMWISLCLVGWASGQAQSRPADAGVSPATPAQSAVAPVPQDPQTKPGIAVLPFTYGGSFGPNKEDLGSMRIGIQEMLLTELKQNPTLRIVERSTLKEMLAEQDLGASGRVDEHTAARIGKLVGARYIIKGQFMDLYGNFRVDGHIVNVETGELVKTVQVSAKPDQLYDLLVQLASRITAGVNLPPLPTSVQNARKARDIPGEATRLYSLALTLQDDGETAEAIKLYRRITQEFPQMTEAREKLTQLTPS